MLATDDQTAELEFSLPEKPVGMDISPTGLITWTPSELQRGEYDVLVYVADHQGEYIEQPYAVYVETPGSAYFVDVISSPVTSATVGSEYSYQVRAITNSDTDIKFSLDVGPLNMEMNPLTGLLSWQPKPEDLGANPVEIKAVDGLGNFKTQRFSVVVLDSSAPPKIISEPVLSVLETRSYEYMVQTENRSDSYVYQVTSSSADATVDSDGRIKWSPESGIEASHFVENTACRIAPLEPGSFDPVEKWHWQGGAVRIAPLVGQLSDDNGDGEINELDTPDVVFSAFNNSDYLDAWLVVLDGETGQPLTSFETPVERFHAYSNFALGDIDNDGIVEIVGMSADLKIIAFDHTGGAPKWAVDKPSNLGIRATPALYDLTGDGDIEILMGNYVMDHLGGLEWKGEGTSTGSTLDCDCMHYGSWGHGLEKDFTSFAMDLLPQYPGQEVIVGNQVYTATGSLLWTASIGDGLSAIADIDLDGVPELVVVSPGERAVGVFNQDGETKWKVFFGDAAGGAPTLSDINGDGYLEIGFSGRSNYFVYSHDGDQLWKAVVVDESSGITGSTVFDFEGDGKADIVVFDEVALKVFDEFGNVKATIENFSGTWMEYPVIVDLDNDGHADMLIPSSDSEQHSGDDNPYRGVRALESQYNTWPDARSVWNQYAYHIDNVKDDGSIPALPVKSYQTHNSFRLSAFPNRFGRDLIDLVLKDLRIGSSDSGKSLSVTLVNRTKLTIDDNINVQFYHGNPGNSGEFLGEVTVTGINALQSQDVSITGVDSSNWNQNIFAVIDYVGEVTECLQGNNQIQATYFSVQVSNELERSDSQEFLVNVLNHNDTLSVSSIPPSSVVVGDEYKYHLVVEDSDLGDAFVFELITSLPGMRIDPISGLLSWSPTNQEVGVNHVIVRVTDLFGVFVDHEFTINVVGNENENHAPYITNIQTLVGRRQYAIEHLLEYIDPDGDAVTFELVDPYDRAEILAGYLRWSPGNEEPAAEAGYYQLKVKVTDEHGAWSTALFPIWLTDDNVTAQDREDGLDIPPEYVIQETELVFITGQQSNYALPMPDGANNYAYELVSGPDGLTEDNNVISWNPSIIGDYPVEVRLTNGLISYNYTFNGSVRESPNRPPYLITEGFPSVHYVNETFEYQFEFNDPDEDPLTFEVLQKPANAHIDENGLFTWTPTQNEIGEQTLQIVVVDSVGMYSSDNTLTFEVKEFRNRIPFFVNEDPSFFAVVGQAYEAQFAATDPDGDPIVFTVHGAPPGAEIDENGKLTIPPLIVTDIGEYDMQVRASDGGGYQAFLYPLQVDINRAPAFTTNPSLVAHVGKPYFYGPRVKDREGHSFTFGVAGEPDNLQFDPESGQISWTPTEEQQGPNQIQISVTDQFGETSTQTLDVYVYSDQIMYRNVCPAPVAYQ